VEVVDLDHHVEVMVVMVVQVVEVEENVHPQMEELVIHLL
jgi:hypothetical protein